jgi:uncharacterized protein YndB with AHSA1/START domain
VIKPVTKYTGENQSKQARYAERKALERNSIHIPPPVDLERRRALLADPVAFLKYYFPDRFWSPFADYQREMIQLIVDVAEFGGDQAIAAPRGDGKTEITKAMIVYLICRGLVRFPLVIAASGTFASRIFDDIRRHFDSNEKLIEDFPEICVPCAALEGTPQRAAKQMHNGKPTEIQWSSNQVVFAKIDGLPATVKGQSWHEAGVSPYSAVCMAWAGMDSAIRGINIRGNRPDFVLVDDPETRESAFHDNQVATRDVILNRDVAGLADGRKRLSRVVLCTIQNNRCLAEKLTNQQKAPSWNGRRYSGVVKWPERSDLWQQYMDTRQEDQRSGDGCGLNATAFYEANRADMDLGGEVLNPERYSRATTRDGRAIELSALQAVYNLIADNGLNYVLTEIQNSPPDEDETETLGLTAHRVGQRLSGLEQHELPKVEDVRITVGLDLGKYYSHWTKIAWFGNATGVVIDYGVMETPGMQAATDVQAVEVALLQSLQAWRGDIMARNPPEFCLVDSGDYSPAVYEFIRRVGGTPFAASKGYASSRWHSGTESATRRQFDRVYASYQPAERVWLYVVDTEHWKGWVHERFVTATFNEAHQFQDGSLSLYVSEDRKRHISFAHHIVAEMREDQFVPGKGVVRKWREMSKNNHWLDATALACAAAGCLGVRLIPRVNAEAMAKQIEKSQRPAVRSRPGIVASTPHGQAFVATQRK